MATYNNEEGVWRTIGGRRVFIRTGQSLSDAMKESGKFSRVKKNEELYKKLDEDKKEEDLDYEYDKAHGAYKSEEQQEKEYKKQEHREAIDKENDERLTKIVADYENGAIDREEALKRFDGDEEKMAKAFEQKGYTAPTKENIDNANKKHEEKQRLELAKDIAKEVYGLNENNASDERIEREARKILEFGDGEVLEKGDEPFTNSKGELERSTKSLEEWRDSLKGNNKDEVVKLPDGTPIDQNYIKDLYSGMSYEEVKRANDFDKEWMSKVNPEARPMQTAKVKETDKYLANMEKYESRIDDKEYGKKDWGEGVYPFSEGTAWKGTKSGQNLSTTEIAKQVSDKMKEAYPGITISRKTSYYSGGSSADFSITASDKPLIRSIDDFSETELNRLYNTGYNSNYYKDVNEFKEALSKRLSKGNIDINKYYIDDNYELTPYGKAVVKDLKKVIDAYNYDESDGMTDYFNTGFYSDISIGKYNKPYVVKEATQKTANATMNDTLRQKAFEKYKKEHPNTKMTFKDFIK